MLGYITILNRDQPNHLIPILTDTYALKEENSVVSHAAIDR